MAPVRGGVAERVSHDLSPRGRGRGEPAARAPAAPVASPVDPSVEPEVASGVGSVTPESALPPLYARWMSELLGAPAPAEPHATCSDCAMTPGVEPDREWTEPVFFAPATKCCTLVPLLPNYLVGQILADGDPHPAAVAGRRSVEARIAARSAVTPLGLGRTLGFSLHYRHHTERFGRSVALRCPHYVEEGGLCGVWRHRAATCATWFCKYERGATSVRFWSALEELLLLVEQELAFSCARTLGFAQRQLEVAFESATMTLGTKRGVFSAHVLDGALAGPGSTRAQLGGRSATEHEALFGPWTGREVELFVAAGELVQGLRFADVEARSEGRLAGAITRARAAHRALLAPVLPERLASRAAEVPLVQLGRGRAIVDSYRAHDPREAPSALLAALVAFDGRPTEEALAAIERAARLRLTPELLRRLVDLGVLVDAS